MGLNWSKEACQAFEGKLGKLVRQKENLDMEDVINRLRTSRNEADERLDDEGYAEGQEWAKRRAEAGERDGNHRHREEGGAGPHGPHPGHRPHPLKAVTTHIEERHAIP